jgi:hypothetical protein
MLVCTLFAACDKDEEKPAAAVVPAELVGTWKCIYTEDEVDYVNTYVISEDGTVSFSSNVKPSSSYKGTYAVADGAWSIKPTEGDLYVKGTIEEDGTFKFKGFFDKNGDKQ